MDISKLIAYAERNPDSDIAQDLYEAFDDLEVTEDFSIFCTKNNRCGKLSCSVCSIQRGVNIIRS